MRALALSLIAGALALAGCGGTTKTVTATRTVAAPPATTTPAPSTTSQARSTATSSGPQPAAVTIGRAEAENLARRAASRDVARFGIRLRPPDWSVACTGGGAIWSCRVNGNGGQCQGTVSVFSSDSSVRTGNPRIGCGE